MSNEESLQDLSRRLEKNDEHFDLVLRGLMIKKDDRCSMLDDADIVNKIDLVSARAYLRYILLKQCDSDNTPVHSVMCDDLAYTTSNIIVTNNKSEVLMAFVPQNSVHTNCMLLGPENIDDLIDKLTKMKEEIINYNKLYDEDGEFQGEV